MVCGSGPGDFRVDALPEAVGLHRIWRPSGGISEDPSGVRFGTHVQEFFPTFAAQLTLRSFSTKRLIFH